MGELSMVRMGGGLKVKSGSFTVAANAGFSVDVGFFAKILFLGKSSCVGGDFPDTVSFADAQGSAGKVWDGSGNSFAISKTETGFTGANHGVSTQITLYYLAIG